MAPSRNSPASDCTGLDLDERLTFKDAGVSAFGGKNAQEGALGAFLRAAENGIVRKGSYLLVENNDRLSRLDPLLALDQLRKILSLGIIVVTLRPEKTYTAANISEIGNLFSYLLDAHRAHDESVMKSKRVSAAWKAKRDKAQAEGAKLTARCPAWLTLASDRKSFTVDTARKRVVRRIFEMTLASHGKAVIARRFNAEGIATFGDSEGWHPSYVQKILENEAVCGVFQPMRMKNGKRVSDGEPIPGYFPAVVERATFERARRSRSARRIPSGRKGENFSNLFTGLVKCGNCGGAMHFVNKGEGEQRRLLPCVFQLPPRYVQLQSAIMEIRASGGVADSLFGGIELRRTFPGDNE
jgi:DNA invertase Pin-like site-specific DNA recombinase